MKFTPLELENVNTNYLLPTGEYDVKVIDADDGLSKAGNPQIKLKLKVSGDGQSVTVFDYLGATSKKLRNFCQNMGLEEKYKSGEVTDIDCLNKTGRASVKIERSDTYGEQNKIAFYVASGSTESKKDDFQDSDIPF
jgi:hypothetical protein